VKSPRFLVNMRLNQKFALMVFACLIVPFIILAAVMYVNMQTEAVTDRLNESRRRMTKIGSDAEKIANLCNMTSQFFLNNPRLIDFLRRAAAGGGFTPEELIAFRRDDVGGFERLVIANPYLYQVRIYYGNEGVPEFMPVLYHASRMERLSWAAGGWASGSWQLDYSDTIFPPEIMKPARNIMALVIEIKDAGLGRIGVMEIAVRMNELFPELFAEKKDFRCAFITEGEIFCHPGENGFWDENAAGLLSLQGPKMPADGRATETFIGGRLAYVSSIPVNQFGGKYITVIFRNDITADLAARRNVFFLIAGAAFGLLVIGVNLIVKAMLRRFYEIVKTVRKIQGGDMNVTAPDLGGDEIGDLAKQFNRMLDSIRRLMDENVKRELLARNSEIRALQSQINAHFIYNVLESIKMMAEVDSLYEISDAVTTLGNMLRYGMQWGSGYVTVKDEIEHVQNYLGLINIRFDYEIALKLDLPDCLLNQEIPKLTVQPIVENAVAHGIEELAIDTEIEIRAAGADAYFDLFITDRGKGIPPERLEAIRKKLAGAVGEESGAKGIGLKNVHDRIVKAYEGQSGVSIDSGPGMGTIVKIRLPYKHADCGALETADTPAAGGGADAASYNAVAPDGGDVI